VSRKSIIRLLPRLFALALATLLAQAQEDHIPEIGSQVPPYVLKARTRSQQCLTYVNHRDPCAVVEIDAKLFTIAWDAQTKAVAYIFTDDRRLVTDSELGVGGSCRLVDQAEQPYKIVNYLDWAITPQWRIRSEICRATQFGTPRCVKETPNSKHGKIIGFVQSRYLNLMQ